MVPQRSAALFVFEREAGALKNGVTLSEAKGPELFDKAKFSVGPDASAPSLRSG